MLFTRRYDYDKNESKFVFMAVLIVSLFIINMFFSFTGSGNEIVVNSMADSGPGLCAGPCKRPAAVM